MKKLLPLAGLLAALISGPVLAATCPSYPYTFVNGTTADATQVNANFSSILTCANTALQPTISILPIVNGGTNATTAGAALTNLGGLAISNNLSDLASASTARTNLGLTTAATTALGTSGATIPLLNGTNVWSGLNTFNNGVTVGSSSLLDIDGAAATSRTLTFTTGALNRWHETANSTGESGSNVGSDLEFDRYSDAGSFIDTPLIINRASGIATFTDGISVSGAAGLPAGSTAGGQFIVTTNDQRFGGPIQNSQVVNYTLVASDAGKQIFLTFNGAQTLTIPANASVAFPIGTKIEVATSGSTTATISINSDTLWWSPSGTTGSRSLSTFGLVTLTKVTGTGWYITGSGIS